jgi:hypothetical protein
MGDATGASGAPGDGQANKYLGVAMSFTDDTGETYATELPTEKGVYIDKIYLSYECTNSLYIRLLRTEHFRDAAQGRLFLRHAGLAEDWIRNNIWVDDKTPKTKREQALIDKIIRVSCDHGELLDMPEYPGYTALAIILEWLIRDSRMGIGDALYMCNIIAMCPLIDPKKATSPVVRSYLGEVTYHAPRPRTAPPATPPARPAPGSASGTPRRRGRAHPSAR